MEQLFLADLAGLTDNEVREHIAAEYSGEPYYGESVRAPDTASDIRAQLNAFDIIIAQESVGSFGCDSSSWFLLKHRETGDLFELNGAHCSCYGFEGQFELERVFAETLREIAQGERRRARFVSCGWKCEGEDADNDAVVAYILRNFK